MSWIHGGYLPVVVRVNSSLERNRGRLKCQAQIAARTALSSTVSPASAMPHIHKPQLYRDVIDALVDDCRNGQGSIGPDRARKGLWNQNATAESMPDQHKFNLLLARLSQEDRETLAEMLAQEYAGGAFAALSVLNDFAVAPFEEGYEGAAYNDFVGRMQDWPWPK